MTRAERKKELKSKIIFAIVWGIICFGWLVPVGMKYYQDYIIGGIW